MILRKLFKIKKNEEIKNDNMKNVCGGVSNTLWKDEIYEELRKDILEADIDSDIALKLVGAIKKYRSVQDFLKNLEDAKNIKSLLKREGLLNISNEAVDAILRLHRVLIKKHRMNNVIGGAMLSSFGTSTNLNDFDFIRIKTDLIQNNNFNEQAVEELIILFKALNSIEKIKAWVRNVEEVKKLLSKYYLNVDELNRKAQTLCLIFNNIHMVDMKNITGGMAIIGQKDMENNVTDALIYNVINILMENLNGFKDIDYSFLYSTLKTYRTFGDLYNILTNRNNLWNLLKRCGANIDITEVGHLVLLMNNLFKNKLY